MWLSVSGGTGRMMETRVWRSVFKYLKNLDCILIRLFGRTWSRTPNSDIEFQCSYLNGLHTHSFTLADTEFKIIACNSTHTDGGWRAADTKGWLAGRYVGTRYWGVSPCVSIWIPGMRTDGVSCSPAGSGQELLHSEWHKNHPYVPACCHRITSDTQLIGLFDL